MNCDRWLVTACLRGLEHFPHLFSENVGDLGSLSILILCESF